MPRLVSLPAPLSLAIAPARLSDLLAAYGAPSPLVARASVGGAPFAREMFAVALDEPAAGATDLLTRLATSGGKRALVDAASALALPLGDAAALPAADLAAHVLALCARDAGPPWRGVVRRARLALAELEDVVCDHELVATEPRRARAVADAERDLRAFAKTRAGGTDVWIAEDEARGAFLVGLLSRDEEEVEVEVTSEGASIPRRKAKLRFDRVHLDVAAGRVAIATRHPHDVRAIAAAIGRAFFGDAGFFSDRPAFTTRPLEILGSAGLAAARLPAPITRMRVIACTKELIGEGRQRATGSRALALLEAVAQGAGGYLPEVTLRFDVAGEELPVDVEVRLPGRFACSHPRWAGLVREAMASLGMLTPGALPDDAWSLFPVRRPGWRLREALGGEAVDALLASAVLRRVVSRNVTTPELRAQGSNLLTFAVPGERGVSYAVSSDPSVPPRDVTDADREVLELDLAKLAALRAREMNLEGESRVIGDGGSLLHGTLRARDAALAFISVLRAPAGPAERDDLVRELVTAVFPAHIVLLVPRGRGWGSPFEVEFEGLVEGGRGLVERAVRIARLEDDVDPWRLTDAPLVVHRKTRRVWLHETLMDLPDSGYAMIEGLALRPGQISTTREVCKWISPAREDLQAARATRPKIVKWMAASFEGAGKRVDGEEIEGVIVVEGKKGYRLGVGVRVF